VKHVEYLLGLIKQKKEVFTVNLNLSLEKPKKQKKQITCFASDVCAMAYCDADRFNAMERIHSVAACINAFTANLCKALEERRGEHGTKLTMGFLSTLTEGS
jgi:hypothetical protein